MTLNIVQVNASVTSPGAPPTLQGTGAILSQGGTTTAVNATTLLNKASDLTAILAGGKALTSLTWTANVATGTTTAPHGWGNGDVIPATIAGVTPTAYNVTDVNITITGTTTFTYPLLTDPGGSASVQGTVTLESVTELLAQVTTFFAQNINRSVYVLELGEGTAAEGVTALTSFITNHPGVFYSYLVPSEWDGVASFLTYLATFTSTTAKTYFFITSTTGTYTDYAALKSAFVMVPAPAQPLSQFAAAAPFAVTLNYKPNSSNQVTPLCYAFLNGVTAYPLPSNQTTLTAINTANANFVGTGAQGGLSNTILFSGHMMDGNPFNYWYSIDWTQINVQIALANEIINGSNNAVAPLYYNQQGIDRLQRRAAQTLAQGVTDGLILGTVIQTQLPVAVFQNNYNNGVYRGFVAINAEPFSVYTTENPGDEAIGKYGGLTVVMTPLRGFEQVIFNLNAVQF